MRRARRAATPQALAWLLRRVFLHDVSVCPRCQGPTTWLEVATEPNDIDQAMVDHGLAAQG